jgi:putative Mg2+ transporter-C (MgtC) family protein
MQVYSWKVYSEMSSARPVGCARRRLAIPAHGGSRRFWVVETGTLISVANPGYIPTRMAQGIMTGIGFLGAGVIFKEGLTVRGLTTAASIWVTAAIGILVGIGFWFAAVVGAVATLIVLALFRYIETRLPSEFYAHHMLRFARDHVIGEEEVRKLIHHHGFTIANLSSRLSESGQQFEYRMTIKSIDRKNAEALSSYLRGRPEVIEFRITPTGD